MSLDLDDLTQASATARWIAANEAWLDDSHVPMVSQLLMLARSMDTDITSKGRVQSSTASTYRGTFETLMRLKPAALRVREAWEEEGALGEPEHDESLLGPRTDL